MAPASTASSVALIDTDPNVTHATKAEASDKTTLTGQELADKTTPQTALSPLRKHILLALYAMVRKSHQT
jgi:hypothetical protein